MQISITNEFNDDLITVSFPCDLPVMLSDEDEVILPGGHPGILVNEPFFTNSESYFYYYPDVFHADYISFALSHPVEGTQKVWSGCISSAGIHFFLTLKG
jgi:hypothetical protein